MMCVECKLFDQNSSIKLCEVEKRSHEAYCSKEIGISFDRKQNTQAKVQQLVSSFQLAFSN